MGVADRAAPAAAGHGLLDVIADGTFGLMRRPADGGRGLDGVAERSAAYCNPAAELLDAAGPGGGGETEDLRVPTLEEAR